MPPYKGIEPKTQFFGPDHQDQGDRSRKEKRAGSNRCSFQHANQLVGLSFELFFNARPATGML
jgi:hypothetical protein